MAQCENNAAGHVGIGVQVAQDTPVVPTRFIRFTDADINPEQDIELLNEGGGIGDRYFVTAFKKTHKHDGSFGLYCRPTIGAALFAYALGRDTVSGAGPYSHVMSDYCEGIPWLTIERSVAGTVIERVVDCVLNTLTIAGEGGNAVTMSAEFFGSYSEQPIVEASDTYESNRPFGQYHGAFFVDASPSEEITRFELKISNNAKEDIFTDSFTRKTVAPLRFSVDLSFTMLIDSDTFYREINYNFTVEPSDQPRTGSFTLDLSYDPGPNFRQLKLEIPNLIYTIGNVVQAGDPDVLMIDVEAKAIYDSGSPPMFKVTAVNEENTAFVT